MGIEFTDRYKALGIPYPDPDTICKGQCEGRGWFPEKDQNSPLWQAAHAKKPHECDGWHYRSFSILYRGKQNEWTCERAS